MLLQKLIQPIALGSGLSPMKLQRTPQTRMFHQLNHLRQGVNELVLYASKLLELDNVHTAEIVNVHCSLQ